MLMFILGLVIGSLGGVFAMCLCVTASRADKQGVYQPTENITTSPPDCGSSLKTPNQI